jgi:chromosomal replication initiator protein
MTGSNIWNEVLSRIETKVNRHIFYTWFKPTSFVGDNGSTLHVLVPNGLFRDWLTKHYAGVLDEALGEVERKGTAIVFITDVSERTQPDEGGAAAPAPLTVGDPLEPMREVAEDTPSGSLAPRYSFDTFIVGPSNQFAHAACRAVAEAPSRSYNPLFIYGGVGLGKTHLMHAIGHYVLTHLKTLKLTYISSERFMNEMINAVRYDRVPGRRHSVPGRQGRDTDRVLPHVQCAVRLAEADRDQQRLPATRNPATRGASSIALRMGIDRGHPVPGPGDEGRHSQAQSRE